MTISIRHALKGEWPEVLAIHRRAIHEIASADYPVEVLNAWGPPAIKPKPEEFDSKLKHGHVILVAEVDGVLAGFGELIPKKNELLAVYVHPDYSRQGVGTAILHDLERLARKKKLSFLQMAASLTAIPFYETHGFQILEPAVHVLQSGGRMDCMKMRKELT